MGDKDKLTIKYMRRNDIFADAFNYYVYGGEQVINPNNLRELDTLEIGVPYGGEQGASQPVQKIRDIFKSLIVMRDKEYAYLLLGIENQSNVHYAMPVRNMVYDALQYEKQVNKAVASHRLSKDYQNVNSDEYLSGFLKDDHLIPVITLVIYFGSNEWDGPLSIHEMFSDCDIRALDLIPDYKINLIAPYSIDDKDFDKFHTSLKEVLLFIKYANDETNMNKLLDSNEYFHHVGIEAVKVINVCTGANIAIKEGEEEVDMCEAIKQMINKAVQQANIETQKAREETKKERMSTLFSNVKSLMEKMGWSLEQSMEILSISESDQNEIKQLIKIKA